MKKDLKKVKTLQMLNIQTVGTARAKSRRKNVTGRFSRNSQSHCGCCRIARTSPVESCNQRGWSGRIASPDLRFGKDY